MAGKENLIEFSILQALATNEEYARKVVPFLKEEYFKDAESKVVYNLIDNFYSNYNSAPSREALAISLNDKKQIPEKIYDLSLDIVERIDPSNSIDVRWMTDATEKFCKERALYLAITKSILIADGQDKKLDTGAIPSILQEALAVSFDSNVGSEYFENASDRYDHYLKPVHKVRFGHNIMNAATCGGYEDGSLNLLMAPQNVGKTLMLCDMAANAIVDGKDVLYISMEMATWKIEERIDCNILDIELDKMKTIGKDNFLTRINALKSKSHGKLYTKQFPTGVGHVGHFRALLEELKIKKNFIPDLIVVDYLGICASQKYKSSNYQSYHAMGFVAQELRALGIEYDVPVWSAVQTNRSGYNNSDVDETSLAESMAIIHVADLMWAIIRTEELDKLNQIMFKQLKSRYANKSKISRFLMGINVEKFKLYNLDNVDQNLVDTDNIAMVKSSPSTEVPENFFKF